MKKQKNAICTNNELHHLLGLDNSIRYKWRLHLAEHPDDIKYCVHVKKFDHYDWTHITERNPCLNKLKLKYLPPPPFKVHGGYAIISVTTKKIQIVNMYINKDYSNNIREIKFIVQQLRWLVDEYAWTVDLPVCPEIKKITFKNLKK